jgi:hypothetical protein
MEWIIVIGSILIILIGYSVIKKAERSLHKTPILQELEPEPAIQEGKPFVLLYGISKLADELKVLFQKHEIEYLQIEDQSQLDKTKDYTHLFATSSSDLDNLLINTLVNRINKNHKRIAVCNNADNQNIFQQSEIECFHGDNVNAVVLFQLMFPAFSTR